MNNNPRAFAVTFAVWMSWAVLAIALMGIGSTPAGDFTVLGWWGIAIGGLWVLFTLIVVIGSFLGLP